MSKRTLMDIESTELCEHCNQRFDVSLPDTDEHRYVCEGCDLVICWDCKEMDKHGNDWCPECAEDPNREWAQHD